uniref:Apple domain-containing protein n=1 Tax=Plectus sambesii TaxID=2011161 RepID=A0A914WD04_9BILA
MAVFARPWVVTLLAAIYAICAASAQQQAASGVSSQLTRIRSGVVIADGALCDNKVSAYFVSDNVQLTSTNVLFYGDVTEEQCAAMCSDNKDIKGRTILCASFNYDHVSFSCRIFREKSKPDGIASVRASPGERFFEKFCLPSSAPLDCGESHFYRADQAVLVGYAKNATIVKTLEECVAVCLNEAFPCKSAMFFYEEGECITNTESAESMPEVFAKEEVDKVVYFENACLNPNAYKNPKNEKHASGGRQTVQKQPQQQQQRQEIKKSIAPEAPKATAAPN